MTPIWMRNWFTKAPRRDKRNKSARRRWRPTLEALETRAVPTASLVKDIQVGPPTSNPFGLLNAGDSVYFLANDGTLPSAQIWKSDGTPNGTTKVVALATNSSDAFLTLGTGLTTANGTRVLFSANVGADGRELWVTDGTPGNASLLKDINPNAGQGSNPGQFLTVGNLVYFTANEGTHGVELWKTDGTPDGTQMVADINPDAGSSSPSNLTAVGDALYFTATDGTHGFELWKSDANGVQMVADLNPDAASSFPRNLTVVNGTLYFTISGVPASLAGLWKTDGTNTQRVKAGLTAGSLTAFHGRLYFTANGTQTSGELWTSDGTDAGTMMVKHIDVPNAATTVVENLTVVNDTLYFSVIDFITNFELWRSDGTPDGTTLVKTIDYGNLGDLFPKMLEAGGLLYFTLGSNNKADELWHSDGTPDGTDFQDINPGNAASDPRELTNVNETLFFTADDGSHGRELWTVPAPANPPGQLQLDADTYLVDETDGGITITVTRTNGSGGQVAVDYATSDGTGIAGTDYAATSGTLTFQNGQTSRTVFIPILDDHTNQESDETFNFTLSNPADGATLGTPASAVVTTHEDAEMSGALQFDASSYMVNETDGTVTLNILRTGGTDGTVSVHYATADGTALAGTDYTSASGALTFTDGEDRKSIVIPILDDDQTGEADESFSIALDSPTGGATLGNPAVANVAIAEDQDQGTAVLQFQKANYHVAEPNGVSLIGGLDVFVTRTGDTQSAVTVHYATADGTARAGVNYRAASGTLTFEKGVVSQVIVLTILDDGVESNGLDFTIALSNPSDGASLGTPSATDVKVTDARSGFAVMDTATVAPNSSDNPIDVLANDFNYYAAEGGLHVLSLPESYPTDHGGLVTVLSDSTAVTYTPASGFVGLDHFRYTVFDPAGNIDKADVVVLVLQVAAPPFANDDAFTVAANSGPTPLDVLHNDRNAPGVNGALQIQEVDRPLHFHGEITDQSATSLSYTPARDFVGDDTFTYSIIDSRGNTATATVTVHVASPPMAVDDFTNADARSAGPVFVDVLANDHNGTGTTGPLTVTAVTQGFRGTVAIRGSGDGVIYTPRENTFGADRFTYTITDVNGLQATATVRINLLADNRIGGQKFNDLNGNGVHDPGEPGLNGWTMELHDVSGNVIDTTVTHSVDLNGDGQIDPLAEQGWYEFTHVNPGDYYITEVPQPGWVQTLPRTVSFALGHAGWNQDPTVTQVQDSPEAIVSADFDGDGRLDLMVTSSRAGGIQKLVNDDAGFFILGAFYDTGAGAHDAVAADFRDDQGGVPDVVVTNTLANTVTFLRNRADGSGTFEDGVSYPTGRQPVGIAAGDFNHDGFLDFAVANSGDNTVSIFFNQGNGTFRVGPTYATESQPWAMAAADFDADGYTDVAVTNRGSRSVTLLFNRQDGTFSASTMEAGGDPRAIVAADLNNDSRPDLAVLNHDSGDVSVFINAGSLHFFSGPSVPFLGGTTATLGISSGYFYPAVSLDAGFQSNTLFGPSYLTVSDFDGDASPDLAVVGDDANGTHVALFRNNGEGTFRSAITVGSDTGLPGDIVGGDFDGDGARDMAILDRGGHKVAVLLNETDTRNHVEVPDDQTDHLITGEDFGNHQLFVLPPRALATQQQQATQAIYNVLLGRSADPAGLAFWSGKMDQGMSAFQVARAIEGSTEFQRIQVENLYEALLQRQADSQGEAAALQFLAHGGALEQLEASLIGSQEYFIVRGGATVPGFLGALSLDVLNRPLDPAALGIWTTLLAQGTSRMALAETVVLSPEAADVSLATLSRPVLGHDPTDQDTSNIHQLFQADVGMSAQAVMSGFTVRRLVVNLQAVLAHLAAFLVQHFNNVAFVQRVYLELLGRLPDIGGQDFWVGLIEAGTSRADVVYDIETSPGNEFYTRAIKDIYVRVLNRPVANPATQAEIGAQLQVLRSGGTFDDVRANLVATSEFAPLDNSNASIQQFQIRLFPALLGRQGDFSGDGFSTPFTDDQLIAFTITDVDSRKRAALAELIGMPLNLLGVTRPLDGAPGEARMYLENGNNQGYFQQYLNQSTPPNSNQSVRDFRGSQSAYTDFATVLSDFEGSRPANSTNTYLPLREEYFIADLLGMI
jgi:ELWxxDGT repeat protein